MDPSLVLQDLQSTIFDPCKKEADMKTMKEVLSSPLSYLYLLWGEQVHARFASFVAHWFCLSEQVLRVSQSCSCCDATHACHILPLLWTEKWNLTLIFSVWACFKNTPYVPRCHVICAIVQCKQLFFCTQKQATRCSGTHRVHLSACHQG